MNECENFEHLGRAIAYKWLLFSLLFCFIAYFKGQGALIEPLK